ncbi:MAG: calcium-binding protein [Planctomycetota bacterium]
MFSKRSSQSRRNKPNRFLSCENLEERRLLAADVTNGVLTIQSEPQARAVPQTVVSQSNHHITVRQNQSVMPFPRNQVRKIVFHGTEKKDVFDNRTNVSATVFGKGGNDILYAGAAHDVIFGGSGNDRIIFHRGGGVAYGQAGADLISAQNTDNRIRAYGGKGRDRIFGGNLADRLYGGSGNDTVSGGKGNDIVSGGGGNDHLWDGDGRDIVLGGGGVDQFYMDYGNRDDGDLDRISFGGWAQLKNEAHFATDYWFSINGKLNEGDYR